MPNPPNPGIPVLLLKTRSQPDDAYEEYFTSPPPAPSPVPATEEGSSPAPGPVFLPEFVPVLEHRPNTSNLDALAASLKSGQLSWQYGGMIFTSQRAVEAWAGVVKRVEREREIEVQRQRQQQELQEDETKMNTKTKTVGTTARLDSDSGIGVRPSTQTGSAENAEPHESTDPIDNTDDTPFPIYSVGPATSRALNTLVEESCASASAFASPFSRLRPAVFGGHGTGEKLAQYMLSHYNELQSRRRTDSLADDAPMPKRPLLFLVGEQRRDIIPKTLMDPDGRLPPADRIQVDEVEVYITAIRDSFGEDFQSRLVSCRSRFVSASRDDTSQGALVVVVVFSPQGCEAMLRSLGYIDHEGTLTEQAKNRWIQPPSSSTPSAFASSQRYVVVTIGPTTRDHLKTTFGFDADVCAAKPSPEGVGTGLMQFLADKGLLDVISDNM